MWYYYLIALGILYLTPLVMLFLQVGKIKQMVEKLKASPKDVADILTRGLGLLIVYFVIVGVVILTLAQARMEGIMSYLLFTVIGWVFGLFTPRSFEAFPGIKKGEGST